MDTWLDNFRNNITMSFFVYFVWVHKPSDCVFLSLDFSETNNLIERLISLILWGGILVCKSKFLGRYSCLGLYRDSPMFAVSIVQVVISCGLKLTMIALCFAVYLFEDCHAVCELKKN